MSDILKEIDALSAMTINEDEDWMEMAHVSYTLLMKARAEIAALREARDALAGDAARPRDDGANVGMMFPGEVVMMEREVTPDEMAQLRQDVLEKQAVVDALMAQPNPMAAPSRATDAAPEPPRVRLTRAQRELLQRVADDAQIGYLSRDDNEQAKLVRLAKHGLVRTINFRTTWYITPAGRDVLTEGNGHWTHPAAPKPNEIQAGLKKTQREILQYLSIAPSMTYDEYHSIHVIRWRETAGEGDKAVDVQHSYDVGLKHFKWLRANQYIEPSGTNEAPCWRITDAGRAALAAAQRETDDARDATHDGGGEQ